jgi:hypothetical protein
VGAAAGQPGHGLASPLAALLHAARLWHWQPWRTRARPILWVLHAAYAWLPVGFLLLAWAQLGGVAASAGIHALAVGATAGLIIGMVTRTARGHTGRPLKVSRLEVAAYLLVAVAASPGCCCPGGTGAHRRLAGCWLPAAWATGFRALPVGLHALVAEHPPRRQGRLNAPILPLTAARPARRALVPTSTLKGSHDCNAHPTHVRRSTCAPSRRGSATR